ncbi:hypothetical protein HY469_00875 [Candidatus Roizmanbacteria bacterium]|nr:hypothetical protein [Candidatus Roizmanbacteria bacterium]
MKNPATERKKITPTSVFFFLTISVICFVSGYLLITKLIPDLYFQSKITTCDVNGDEYCDLNDLAFIHDSMGSCRGDLLFQEQFDIDGDGCLSKENDLPQTLEQYYAVIDFSQVPTPVITPYDPICDLNADLVCDTRDIQRQQHINMEKNNIALILQSLDQYKKDSEQYPVSLDYMVPDFFNPVPPVNNLEYKQVSSGTHFELCYETLSTNPPQKKCITR